MSVIPCSKNDNLGRKIVAFAETLKHEAHKLGDHGLDASEFYNSGLFRGAIERIRGQFAATMTEKRLFVNDVPNLMQKRGFISACCTSNLRPPSQLCGIRGQPQRCRNRSADRDSAGWSDGQGVRGYADTA